MLQGLSAKYFILSTCLLSILILSSRSFAVEAAYKQHITKGMADIETNNFSAAIEEFRGALKEKPDDHEATLYLAIALSRSGNKEAETLLKKLLTMDPEEPRTNLELGIYYFAKSIFDEAMDYFENTIKLAPNTEFSAKAEEYISRIKQRETAKRWALGILAGGQYDSNVILSPTDSPLPQGISRKSDWKTVFQLNSKYNILKDGNGEASIGYSLYQNLNSKLSDFNITQHLLELSGGYNLSQSLNLRGTYSFEYTLVGGNGYDYTHSISPSLIISEGNDLFTILEYRYRNAHFMDSDLFTDNSDRTGSNNLVGITQYMPLSPSVKVKAGYYHDQDSTRKDFWDYKGNKGFAGLRFNFFENALIYLYGEYYTKDYAGINPLSTDKRKDRAYTATITVTKPLSERCSVSIGQLYTRNKSNIEAYDYSRAITSIFFGARF